MFEYIKFLHFKYWTHGWDGLGPLLMWNPDIIEVAEPPKANIVGVVSSRIVDAAQFFVIYLPLVLSGFVLSVVIGIPVSFLRRKV